jgi:hypothetical protein
LWPQQASADVRCNHFLPTGDVKPTPLARRGRHFRFLVRQIPGRDHMSRFRGAKYRTSPRSGPVCCIEGWSGNCVGGYERGSSHDRASDESRRPSSSAVEHLGFLVLPHSFPVALGRSGLDQFLWHFAVVFALSAECRKRVGGDADLPRGGAGPGRQSDPEPRFRRDA